MKNETLLAVDAGLRCGLAAFGDDGKILWYRSRNYGTHSRLKRRIYSLLAELSSLRFLVLEGGGNAARPWSTLADRRGIKVLQISAEKWRRTLLHHRDRRTGAIAKNTAIELARSAIEWSKIQKPASLRHDAAEAILIGFWGAHQTGLLSTLPDFIHQ